MEHKLIGVTDDVALPAPPGVAGPDVHRIGLTRRWCCAALVVGGAILLWTHPWLWVHALCLGSGLVAGFLAGLLGIGGALVIVPVLYLVLPFQQVAPASLPQVAVATSLLVMVPSAAVNVWAQSRRKALDWGWFRQLAPGTALGSILGALFAQQSRGSVLTAMFVCQSVFFGWGHLRARELMPGSRGARLRARVCATTPRLYASLVAWLCSSVGMGSGSLFVPYLQTHGLEIRPAVATASSMNLCIAVCGVAIFSVGAGVGGIGMAPEWTIALAMASGSVCAVPWGVSVAHRLSVVVFRRLLGGVTLMGVAVMALLALR